MQRFKEEEMQKRDTFDHGAIAQLSIALQNKTGLNASQIMTSEQLRENNEKYRSNLFHALNASIVSISQYLTQVQNDDSYEWTAKLGTLSDENGNRFSIDGQINVFDEETSTAIIISHAQLYEIERQKICLELTTLWNLFVFWKKTAFPENSIFSYHANNAHALCTQVEDLYQKRQNALKNMPLSAEKDNHYAIAIVDMLANITQNMPKQRDHMVRVSRNTTPSSVFKRTDEMIGRAKNDIQQKRDVYFNCYYQFVSESVQINKCLSMLQLSPFEVCNSEFFAPNLKMLYQNYQNFKFPGDKRAIRFASSPLDFVKLLPGLINVQLMPTLVQDNSDTTIKITEEKPKEACIDETAQKEIIYDAAYWQEQNAYHAERKKPATITSSATVLTPYEIELYTYLNEKIYKYVKRKGRAFKDELREIKFKVVSNKSGKGSLHYVYPTDDNPLFGFDPNYAEAYFNLHLPHNDGDIIPSAYFDFAQSGFGNVFGLSLEYITEKLKKAQI